MTAAQPAPITALLEPARYPHPVMAAFQDTAAVASANGPWEKTADVMAFARDNVAALHAGLKDASDVTLVDALNTWTEAHAAQLAPLLAQRLATGRVVAGGARLCGVGATHRTTIRATTRHHPWPVWQRQDVERKRLHGLSATQASGSGLNTGLYRPQAHTDTYAHLLERTRHLLQAGWSVLVDAAFLRHHEREAFAELARAAACPFHILATVTVLEQQLGWLEPLGEDERARYLPAAS